MLDYEKRLLDSFRKLSYEQQKDILRSIEMRNTIFEYSSIDEMTITTDEDLDGDNFLEPIVNLICEVVTIPYILFKNIFK